MKKATSIGLVLLAVLALSGSLVLGGCPSKTCEYAGKRYAAGEGFPATDGCNTCRCDEGLGQAVCTQKACADKATVALRLRIDAPNASVLHAKQAIVEVGGESQTLTDVAAGPIVELGQQAVGKEIAVRITNGDYPGRLTAELLVNGEAAATGSCEGAGCEARLTHRL